jgi:hypothetical protein
MAVPAGYVPSATRTPEVPRIGRFVSYCHDSRLARVYAQIEVLLFLKRRFRACITLPISTKEVMRSLRLLGCARSGEVHAYWRRTKSRPSEGSCQSLAEAEMA